MIMNTITHRYLTVQNGKASVGANVCEYDADGIADYNTWYIALDDNSQYTLRSALGSLYLAAGSGGSLVLESEDKNSVYQKFNVDMTSDANLFRLTAGGYCAAPEASETNGADVRMSDASDSLGVWKLIPVNNITPGDINNDGTINVFDLVYAKKLLLHSTTVDIVTLSSADVSNSGSVDAKDVKFLQQFLLAQSTEFSRKESAVKDNTIFPYVEEKEPVTEPSTEPVQQLTLADMPEEYKEPMEWIWQNRIVREGSVAYKNTIIDQIIAGNGTLNYVVRWQSYKTITYEQRQQLEQLTSDCINSWTDYLRGYDDWPYDHVDVKIVGWAVLDRNCLLDLQDNEVVYDYLISDYDSQYDTSNGYETIPDKLPSAPDELSRLYRFENNLGYDYPGGLESRFDMYLWATQGFPAVGGTGRDFGQRLSDYAYLNMLNGSSTHVFVHEIGHGFGLTDFYGENGTNDGPPPNGFPDDGTSIMMAVSSANVTPFDAWMLRYIWSQLKNEYGRF